MNSFPSMPYGMAPQWCFPIFEYSIYFFFLLCLFDAWKKGKSAIAYLIGGLVFGCLLEYMEVVLDSYTYGRFAIMVGSGQQVIPLCIGVAWGVIMYTARLLSNWFGLTLWEQQHLTPYLH